MTLVAKEDVDEDAREMDSQEVLREVEERTQEPTGNKQPEQRSHQRFGSISNEEQIDSPQEDVPKLNVRASVLRSLEYLRPLLQK